MLKRNILMTFVFVLAAAVFSACPSGSETNSGSTSDATPAPSAETTPDETKASSENPKVGGAEMSADKDIIDNAVNSKDHTTLVAAVKAAGLVETLKGEGPFTVFAPTSEAFSKLPEGTVDTLLRPENKDKLKGILTYHVVAGNFEAAAVAKAIEDGGGKATLKTVQGEELTASMDGDSVIITDAQGGKAKVSIADGRQKNGVIHVVDSVLLPSK
jgi:uncharacterized surface protein with fasciclin (FAS1) repeats